MKVLTVRQPWAWAIIHVGKDIENRTWATQYRGPLVIHASKRKPTRWEMDDCAAYFAELGISLPDIDELAYGVVIGQVDLVDCVSASESPWWQGPVGWLVANPRPLPQTPLKGQLGLFEAEIVPARRSAARRRAT